MLEIEPMLLGKPGDVTEIHRVYNLCERCRTVDDDTAHTVRIEHAKKQISQSLAS